MAKNTFETHLTALRQSLERLEKDDVSLDEALDAYESGVKEYKACRDYLVKARGRLTQINALLEEEPLEPSHE